MYFSNFDSEIPEIILIPEKQELAFVYIYERNYFVLLFYMVFAFLSLGWILFAFFKGLIGFFGFIPLFLFISSFFIPCDETFIIKRKYRQEKVVFFLVFLLCAIFICEDLLIAFLLLVNILTR